MHIEQPDKSRDLDNLSILLAIALCLGIYLIAITAIISKDGIIYIKYAKQLDSAFVQTIKDDSQPPDYPSLILAAHKTTDLLHKKNINPELDLLRAKHSFDIQAAHHNRTVFHSETFIRSQDRFLGNIDSYIITLASQIRKRCNQ